MPSRIINLEPNPNVDPSYFSYWNNLTEFKARLVIQHTPSGQQPAPAHLTIVCLRQLWVLRTEGGPSHYGLYCFYSTAVQLPFISPLFPFFFNVSDPWSGSTNFTFGNGLGLDTEAPAITAAIVAELNDGTLFDPVADANRLIAFGTSTL